MPDPIWVKAILKALILPPAGPLLLSLAGILLWRRMPRAGRALAVLGTTILLLLSIPAVAWLLLRSIDRSPPLTPGSAANAQAVVILGSGVRRNAPEYGGDTLGRFTLERVRYGARVAQMTGLPVLVSGGTVYGGTEESILMRDALQREYGVAVRWVENVSRTTHENAVRSAEVLRAAGISRVVLVVHSADMPRARAEFAAVDIDTIPAPTVLAADHLDLPLDLLPSMGALQGSYHALYEILGNLVRIATADRK